MPEQIKVITSRRAYEFSPDDLRLSMLSIKPVQELIQQNFQFQASAYGTPFPTFGDVPATIPAGLVFNTGAWLSAEEPIVPIRFLNVEQSRIVIDVGGPSTAITTIFDHLIGLLSQLHAPDGSPVIGEPKRFLDYSEITAHFPASLDTILKPSLQQVFSRAIGMTDKSSHSVLIPSLALQAYPDSEMLPAVPGANDSRVFTFTLRSGTRPEEHIYFSGAPLDSEAHLKYLAELEMALT